MNLTGQTMKTLPNGDQEIELTPIEVRSSFGGGESGGVPTIKGRNVRQMLKESVDKSNPAQSMRNFQQNFRKLLGIEVVRGPKGRTRLVLNESKAQIGFDEFSIRDLSYEFLGRDFVDSMGNLKTAGGATQLLREALAPNMASAQQDINAFNATVGGLIEVRILKGYQLPDKIGDRLFDHMPTKVNGGKVIGIPNLILPTGPTAEGQEYPNVGIAERWVIAQPNVKYAQKVSLTRESLIYDLTGELGNAGESMGMSLGYIEEYWKAAVAQGVDIIAGTPGFMGGRTCNTYIYNGQTTDTPNATYQTAKGTGTSAKYNFINKKQTNKLIDWKNFQTVQGLLNLMREFETGYPISAKLRQVVVSPNKEYNARVVVHASQVLPFSGSGVTDNSQVLGGGTFSANPIPNVELLSSQIWNKVLVDSGVAQADADEQWYAGDLQKSFVWRSVWDMSVVQANPLVPEMLGSDIVNAWYASWYGTPMVRDPRYTIENTD